MEDQNSKKYRHGWRNNYRQSMPVFEAWSKDLLFGVSDFYLWMRNRFRLPSLLVYPDFPSKKSTIRKIAKELGYRITNKPCDNPEVILYFEDVTFGNSAALTQKYPKAVVLNESCTDISKQKVDEIHQRIFGYCTIINPLTYSGVAVRKSDMNALHDGQTITCPLQSREDGSVYQVLIDNSVGAGMVVDFRVPVINYEVVLAYKKFKKESVRFTNLVSYSELHSHQTIFSSEELERIGQFCKAMGVQFCELDVLRNLTDGRIYIIDVNKTPYGPPAGLPKAAADAAILALTEAFKRLINSTKVSRK